MAVLQTNHATMRFGGLTAVDDLNLHVDEKEIVAVIGPNGAGKTTAFNMITGVYRPSEGSIDFQDQCISHKRPDQIARLGVARTFQNIRLFKNMSVIDNVKIGLHNEKKYSALEGILRLPRYFREEAEMDAKAMDLLKVFDLDGEADYLACNLPYGKQRKLEIARALATDPKLLLLDEPAAGMNPNETDELMQTIKFVRSHFDIAILLIEHDMRLVAGICEEVTVLNFGTELAHGATDIVLKDPRVITAYLGE